MWEGPESVLASWRQPTVMAATAALPLPRSRRISADICGAHASAVEGRPVETLMTALRLNWKAMAHLSPASKARPRSIAFLDGHLDQFAACHGRKGSSRRPRAQIETRADIRDQTAAPATWFSSLQRRPILDHLEHGALSVCRAEENWGGSPRVLPGIPEQ